MDLSTFQQSTSSLKASSVKGKKNNFLKSKVDSIKNWIYPPTTTGRTQRMQQYKDLSIFFGAILVTALFEDKIRSYLEFDADMSKMQGQF